MSTTEGNGFRPLEHYKADFPNRVAEPGMLDRSTVHTLLLRAVNAPVHMGAYANLVHVQEVKRTTPGLYVVEFVLLDESLRKHSELQGEFFDGVWNSQVAIGVPVTQGSGQFQLVDGFVAEKRIPAGGRHHVDVSRDRELVGV